MQFVPWDAGVTGACCEFFLFSVVCQLRSGIGVWSLPWCSLRQCHVKCCSINCYWILMSYLRRFYLIMNSCTLPSPIENVLLWRMPATLNNMPSAVVDSHQDESVLFADRSMQTVYRLTVVLGPHCKKHCAKNCFMSVTSSSEPQALVRYDGCWTSVLVCFLLL